MNSLKSNHKKLLIGKKKTIFTLGNTAMSKLANFSLLKRDSLVSLSLPRTYPYSIQNLGIMLKQYSILYIKPDDSCQGKGAIRIDRLPNGRYLLRSSGNKNIYVFRDITLLHQQIQRIKMKRGYLIQQGITSQTPSGKMVDIRVHLLRLNRKWTPVAMAARIAPTRNVVTNLIRGGQPMEINKLLTSELKYTKEKANQKKASLSTIATRVGQLMSAKHPFYTEFGVDIGIDKNGKLWIYEVNIRPDARVFKFNYPLYLQLLRLRKQAR